MRHPLLLAAIGLLSACATGPSGATISGIWAGNGMQLTIHGPSSVIRLACSAAVIDQLLVLDLHDSLSAPATYWDSDGDSVPTRVRGRLSGDTLALSFSAEGLNFHDALIEGRSIDFGHPLCPV